MRTTPRPAPVDKVGFAPATFRTSSLWRASHGPGSLARLAGEASLAGLYAAKPLETPSMRVDEFDFELAEERIALKPASPRDSARLLHAAAVGFGDLRVSDLPTLLKPGDLLVVNDTRVIPAQLDGARAARAGDGAIAIDVTLIKRLAPSADDSALGVRWSAFVRPAKRLKSGDKLSFDGVLRAIVEERRGAEAVLRFNLGAGAFDRALAEAGRTPLPPYIARKRQLTLDDARAYQTIYAVEPGSIAAPTAGLHFTERLLAALAEKGVARTAITLHVGPGTFLPVTADDTRDHKMHAEWGEITEGQASMINETRARGGRIIAVGTTSLRLIESAADESGVVRPYCGETDIFITPGYRFRAVDALLTNFHLPRSTLFMLVCAFAGAPKMKRAYAHAIERGYRFYSYGDACFLERAA